MGIGDRVSVIVQDGLKNSVGFSGLSNLISCTEDAAASVSYSNMT